MPAGKSPGKISKKPPRHKGQKFVFPDERSEVLMRGISHLGREEWKGRLAVFSGQKLMLERSLLDCLENPGGVDHRLLSRFAGNTALDRLKEECHELSIYFHKGGLDFAAKNHSFRAMILITDTLQAIRFGQHTVSKDSPFHGLVGAKVSIGGWHGNFELAYLKLDNEIEAQISRKYGKTLQAAGCLQDVPVKYAEIEEAAVLEVFGRGCLEEYWYWKRYARQKNFFDFLEERAGG